MRETLTSDYQNSSLALLDRLQRLDPLRKALQDELIQEDAGLPAEVLRAYLRILRVMDELGLHVAD